MLSMDMLGNFVTAISMLQQEQPFEKSLMEMRPPPSCIVSDKFISWAASTAFQFKIPRILFDGMSCFTLLCNYNLHKSEVYKHVTETEPFVVPGLPHQVEFTKAQLSGYFNPGSNKKLNAMRRQVRDAEEGAYGVLVNTFEELEPEYVRAYREATGNKVWCISPVSLCNKEISEKAERVNKTSIEENKCLNCWIHGHQTQSFMFASEASIA
ncbi:hypothetical protein SLA2020_253660 [Shorea laevis]